MRVKAILKVLGILLMIFSVGMIPPILVGLWYQDGGVYTFFISFCITFISGFLLWIFLRTSNAELRTRDGFLVVALVWITLSIYAAIPLYIGLYPKISATNAMFEAVSGLTTTGATVLLHLDLLPHATLYYRQQLNLFGGIGIIVLAVAVLPMLGIGGMQLYKAEIAGPVKTSKMTPRITQTAKALWYIYFGLDILCTLSYWLAGMPLFDAIGDSFSTVATGGFSVHDASFAAYHSIPIEIISVIFMILGATNFSLHFQALKHHRLSMYARDPEFIAYLKILAISTLIVGVTLLWYNYYNASISFMDALYTVVSISTTTGLTVANFSLWPSFLPYFLMLLGMMGGCGGSTTGGLKIVRCLLLKLQVGREIKKLSHPKAVLAIKLGKNTLAENIVQAIWGFVTVSAMIFIIILLIDLAIGLDFTTAFGSAIASLSNTGASIGKVAINYRHIPVAARWISIFSMLAGRLEIFTLLVLLTPEYWKD